MPTISIYLPDNLAEVLKKSADHEKLSLSKYIARILSDYEENESDFAIQERINQLDLKFQELKQLYHQEIDAVQKKLLLIESSLSQALAQLVQLKK